jgi:uncharacterized protein (DUF362 family)
MATKTSLPSIAIVRVSGGYPDLFPYDPDENYPEYNGINISSRPNPVYASVRETFRLLGLDKNNFGKKQWNPLGHLIRPGERVFIKPNLVTHEYRKSCRGAGDLFSVITHPSVIRAVADYVAIALKRSGEIVIGDNPSIDADFKKISETTNLTRFEKFYHQNGTNCRVLDLRPRITDELANYGIKKKTKKQSGDPEGNTVLNLADKSCFYGMNPLLYRGVFTKRFETIKHHHGRTHRYSISNTILNSDVYISIPKLKTHHKVGATLNIKGLVGVNANKNYLIHWRIGFPLMGGDEFPSSTFISDYLVLTIRHLLIDLLPESIYSRIKSKLNKTKLHFLLSDISCFSFEKHRGAWKGNDTCWRMAADLYKVFIQDASDWRKNGKKKLKTFSLVDGVVGGQGNGPFCPSAKNSKVIFGGENLLLVDCVGVRLMDFDIKSIKYLDHLINESKINLGRINISSNDFNVNNFFESKDQYLNFQPPSGWNHLTTKNGSVS